MRMKNISRFSNSIKLRFEVICLIEAAVLTDFIYYCVTVSASTHNGLHFFITSPKFCKADVSVNESRVPWQLEWVVQLIILSFHRQPKRKTNAWVDINRPEANDHLRQMLNARTRQKKKWNLYKFSCQQGNCFRPATYLQLK